MSDPIILPDITEAELIADQLVNLAVHAASIMMPVDVELHAPSWNDFLDVAQALGERVRYCSDVVLDAQDENDDGVTVVVVTWTHLTKMGRTITPCVIIDFDSYSDDEIESE